MARAFQLHELRAFIRKFVNEVTPEEFRAKVTYLCLECGTFTNSPTCSCDNDD